MTCFMFAIIDGKKYHCVLVEGHGGMHRIECREGVERVE